MRLWAWLCTLFRRQPRKRKRPYGKRLRADRRGRKTWKYPWKGWVRRIRKAQRPTPDGV